MTNSNKGGVIEKKIHQKNIEKQYVIDLMADKAGCFVQRLLSYHCILNPIEMVWNQLTHLFPMHPFSTP